MVAPLKLETAPGAQHLYSNLGYMIAGHMLEEALDAPWEELMREHLFTPLGMDHAGFGGTGTLRKVDQPWPHLDSGKPTKENGPMMDNVAVLGPAGTSHASLKSWGQFIAEHLAAVKGRGRLLTADQARHLHTPVQGGDYAYGWTSLKRGWGGTVITHNGSNTMNHSVTWLAPEKGFAIIACTNQGGAAAAKALDEVASALILSRQA